MKRARRVLLLLSALLLAVCVTLLLNFTAPNPTGRRYSSETPPTTGEASGRVIGSEAERILANDLHVPNNNDFSQLQCLCQTAVVTNSKACNLCLPAPGMQSAYRVPDFISPNFIAESKNARNLLYTGREFDQISDYALAAKILGRPLWVFIRVNTYVEPDFYQVVASTGGGVVPYFAVPGYADPIDEAACTGLLTALVLGVVCATLEWRSHRIIVLPRLYTGELRAAQASGDGGSASSGARPEPVRKIEQAEDFLARAKDRLQSKIDAEDEWNDL